MTNNNQPAISGWRKYKPIIVFLLSFALFMSVFYYFYYSVSVRNRFFYPIVDVYARLSSFLLNIMGYQTHELNNTISSPGFSVDVKMGCDAIEPMALFIAGVLSFPSSIKKKITGMLAGILILFIVNLLRIISLFIAGLHSPSLFEILHVGVWQVLFILLALGMWFFWLKWSVSKSSAS